MNPEVSNEEIARAVLDLMGRRGYRPLTLRALLHQLRLHRGERLRLRGVLQRLVEQGTVVRTASKRYAPLAPPSADDAAPAPHRPMRIEAVQDDDDEDDDEDFDEGHRPAKTWVPGSGDRGRVTGRVSFTREGYGFLAPDPPYKGDLFVPARERLGACHKDRVEAVVLTGRDGRSYARVLKVLERHFQTVVGLYEKTTLGGRVTPSRDRNLREIRILPGDHGKARTGDLVEVDIMQFPTSHRADLIGRVSTVFGPISDPRIDLKVIAREFDIPLKFPPAVEVHAKNVARITPADLEGRVDLREELTFTIDGEDARDFDDAISLKLLAGGKYQLGVHIADVSHYVTEGSVLEAEARQRATSTYFPEAAVPMLPEILSNGVCSLVPQEDRLTLTCVMTFSKTGERIGYQFFTSVIKSQFRLTYGKVERMLVGDDRPLKVEYEAVYPTLTRMASLARILKKKRIERGSLDFAINEAKVILDENLKVKDIKPLGDPVARNLIEEFMIAANEAVASLSRDKKLPMVFRIHEIPEAEKIFQLVALAESLDIDWRVEDPTDPRELQGLLDLVEKHTHGNFLRTLLLRSMKQARYHPVNVGHFGLASTGYTHFTSPIRRYPDLLVHRLVKHNLKAPELSRAQYGELVDSLEERSVHSSDQERRSQDAERAGVALKMARYMEDKVGRVFEARISGVAQYGLFVTLEQSLVDGLVSTRELPRDNYRYSETGFSLTGELSGIVYRLGGKLTVRCSSVDVLARQINFTVVTGGEERRPRARAADVRARDRERERERRTERGRRPGTHGSVSGPPAKGRRGSGRAGSKGRFGR
jgi:ribonuclease R